MGYDFFGSLPIWVVNSVYQKLNMTYRCVFLNYLRERTESVLMSAINWYQEAAEWERKGGGSLG